MVDLATIKMAVQYPVEMATVKWSAASGLSGLRRVVLRSNLQPFEFALNFENGAVLRVYANCSAPRGPLDLSQKIDSPMRGGRDPSELGPVGSKPNYR